jgi:hypothetical protein
MAAITTQVFKLNFMGVAVNLHQRALDLAFEITRQVQQSK